MIWPGDLPGVAGLAWVLFGFFLVAAVLGYWLHVRAERAGEEIKGFVEDAPASMIWVDEQANPGSQGPMG